MGEEPTIADLVAALGRHESRIVRLESTMPGYRRLLLAARQIILAADRTRIVEEPLIEELRGAFNSVPPEERGGVLL